MVLVKTFSASGQERGLIECETLEYYDRDSLICVDTECVYGAVDVIDYFHGIDAVSVVISATDLSQATAA